MFSLLMRISMRPVVGGGAGTTFGPTANEGHKSWPLRSNQSQQIITSINMMIE